MGERFLITGALGCIGAWAAILLVREGIPVVAFDLGTDDRRLRLISSPEEVERVTFVRGDISDVATCERAISEHGITHVVHLAAMLIPLVADDPPRGALVNVVGTTNVFEAARRRGVRGISYASSVAAYGPDDGTRVGDARAPETLYGVFKLANEGTARVYWERDGVGSVGLRPYVVYGPGRDTGLTAAPTLAMEAAARGEPYEIGFSGAYQMHYAPDAARTFIAAARAEHAGASVFNLGGPASDMTDVVAAIEAAAPEAAGRITFSGDALPFPAELETGALGDVVGYAPSTPLADGVRETIDLFQRRG